MALVMLPCDMPWWPQLQRHLSQLALCRSPQELAEAMHRIHAMCNIGLDPDEDEKPDPSVFQGLARHLECGLTAEETRRALEKTLPAMARRALQLRQLRPPRGLRFSLQQQADRVEMDRNFLASLLAHAFFSTFPKRTLKTHPTLQDFNFSRFFQHLDSNSQKAKLRSVLHYFDLLEESDLPDDKILFSRQVMGSKEWLTIEDWLECSLPLCPLAVRHEGRVDRADPAAMTVCFSTSRLGGRVLDEGSSQESIQFCTHPELLAAMQFVEALEDNEVLMVQGVLQVARISDPHLRAVFEPIHKPSPVAVCCMDAENYMRLPLSQFEEDNVLRELNKALLAFRQQSEPPASSPSPPQQQQQQQSAARRLSPIGESFSSTPSDADTSLLAARKESSPTPRQKGLLRPPSPADGRRGRFIVLGSSGDSLPVTRSPVAGRHLLAPRQSDSGDEEFHSAKSSLDADEDSDVLPRRYSAQLDTPERRSTFAARLRDALCHEAQSSSSTDSSYAVGISVAGSGLTDGDIKVRRGGSRGFMLRDDSLDGQMLQDCQQQEWLGQCHGGRLARRDTSQSSQYSFSADYGSELEELYDQYSRWLEDAERPGGQRRELSAREAAVVRFAGSLLKRTLSESFAGVPVAEPPSPAWDAGRDAGTRLATVARSLSLELARHKHRLAAQLVSMLAAPGGPPGLRPVATGNWGCGSTHAGEPQLKVALQWLAASVAGVPSLQYYTCAHRKLLKLDTVCRVLLDRRWTVGDLARAVLRHARTTLRDASAVTLFDELIAGGGGGGDKAAAVSLPVPGV
ncbi:uncharacterized protein LOC134531936 [Bacillus rossius redtenbacheri]|uniref:uncharacterized protein LOC134531936 n=1 Tax=Bacillus rossius redtenbacheri TaxID=93214 RepID=UPI002FDEB973